VLTTTLRLRRCPYRCPLRSALTLDEGRTGAGTRIFIRDIVLILVIGLPGDKVACCNAFGQMSVNGVPPVEPYIDLPAGDTHASTIDFSVTVPGDGSG
jgi:hypothetical protein